MLVFTAMYGISNNAIYLKLLIFSMWLMERKMFLSAHIIDIRNEPTLPGPAGLGPTRPGLDALWRVFSETFFFSNQAGPTFHHGHRLYGKENKHFLFHKPHQKIKSFRDIAVFKDPYMTVRQSCWLQARSASLHVARNYLTEEENMFYS